MTKLIKTIRVLIAEDHDFTREAICSLLEEAGGIEVVGLAIDGRHAVELAMEKQPDVILMDYSMPEMKGDEAIRRILAQRPAIPIIAMSASAGIERKMREAGACDYVHKERLVDEVAATVKAVAQRSDLG